MLLDNEESTHVAALVFANEGMLGHLHDHLRHHHFQPGKQKRGPVHIIKNNIKKCLKQKVGSVELETISV